MISIPWFNFLVPWIWFLGNLGDKLSLGGSWLLHELLEDNSMGTASQDAKIRQIIVGVLLKALQTKLGPLPHIGPLWIWTLSSAPSVVIPFWSIWPCVWPPLGLWPWVSYRGICSCRKAPQVEPQPQEHRVWCTPCWACNAGQVCLKQAVV